MTHPEAIAAAHLVSHTPAAARAIMDRWLDHAEPTVESATLAGYTVLDPDDYLGAVAVGIQHPSEIAAVRGYPWRCLTTCCPPRESRAAMPIRDSWKTKWGELTMQSEKVHGEPRIYYAQWHGSAIPVPPDPTASRAPPLPGFDYGHKSKRHVSRMIQRWVDENGGEKP